MGGARKIPQTWDAQDRSCYHPPKFYFPASGEGGKLRLAPTTYRGPGHAGGHGTHKGAWGSKTREASRIGLKREEGSTWMTRVYTGVGTRQRGNPDYAAHILAGGRGAPKGPSFSVPGDLPCEPIPHCLFPPGLSYSPGSPVLGDYPTNTLTLP